MRKSLPPGELNLREQLFVLAYAADPEENGKQAALSAGYSQKCAQSHAHKMLKRPAIIRAIEKARRSVMEQANISATEVLRKLAALVTFDPKDMFDENGYPRPIHEMPEGCRLAVTSHDYSVLRLEEDRQLVRVKIGYKGREKYLELLMRYLGMLKERGDETGRLTDDQLDAEISRLVAAPRARALALPAARESEPA